MKGLSAYIHGFAARTLFLALGGASMLSACTEDDVTTARRADAAVSFVKAAPATRTISNTLMEYTGDAFGVFAGYYPTDVAARQDYMQNVKVNCNGGVCTTDDTYYWPTSGKLHFAAYSPYMDDAEQVVTMPDAPYAGYRFHCDVDGRTNLMFADEQQGTLDDFSGGAVPVIFRHALSKLTFNVRAYTLAAETTTWAITLNSITVKNVRRHGDISFTHNGGTPNEWVSNSEELWNTYDFATGASAPADTVAKYIGSYTMDNLSMPVAEEFTKVPDSLFVMPQQLLAADAGDYVQTVQVDYTVVSTITDTYTGKVVTETDQITAQAALNEGAITHWRTNDHITYNIVLSPADIIEFDPVLAEWVDDSGVTPWHVSASVQDTVMGSVTIDGEAVGSVATFKNTTLLAIPAAGHKFVKWTDGAGNTVSTDNPYVYTGTTDAAFVAHFEVLPYYTVTVAASDSEGGTVSVNGAGETSDIYDGNKALLTATAASGYEFHCWVDADGNVASYNAVYEYSAANGTHATFTAVFVEDIWTARLDGKIKTNEFGTLTLYEQYVTVFNATVDGVTTPVYSITEAPAEQLVKIETPITVQRGTSFTLAWKDTEAKDGLAYCHFTGYIDVNGDGTFSQDVADGEFIDAIGNVNTTNGNAALLSDASITVDIPATATVGRTHMRLRFDGAWVGGWVQIDGKDAKEPDAETYRMIYEFMINITE